MPAHPTQSPQVGGLSKPSSLTMQVLKKQEKIAADNVQLYMPDNIHGLREKLKGDTVMESKCMKSLKRK
eukprot:scaffold210329_cov15-Tisochrysis_lutea.AAC.1